MIRVFGRKEDIEVKQSWGVFGLIVKEYWLKMNDQLVAEIHHDEDTNLLSMEIINPDIFFGRLDKLYFNDAMVRRWMESRLTPEYQGEYNKFLYKLGLTGEEPDVRWQVFLRTRGANVKDKMWLAFRKDETYEEGSPWYKLLNPDLFPDAVKEVITVTE